MAVYGVSRWPSPDGFVWYIKIDGDPGSYSIQHFCNYSVEIPREQRVDDDGDGIKETKNEIKTFTQELFPIGGGVYTYELPEQPMKQREGEEWEEAEPIKLKANWKLFDGGELVVDYHVEDEVEELEEKVKQPKVPRGDLENASVVNRITRVWKNNEWGNLQRKVSTANATPDPTSAAIYTVTVPDDMLFERCFQPQTISREALVEALEDPMALFKSNTGRAFVIVPFKPKRKKKEEGEEVEEEVEVPLNLEAPATKIVIPLSDGVRAWAEEYNINDFMTTTVAWPTDTSTPGALYQPTKYTELTETKRVEMTTVGSYLSNARSYRYADVPGVFSTELNAIESEYNDSSVTVSNWNFGVGSGRGFQTTAGGIIAGNDNFLSLS